MLKRFDTEQSPIIVIFTLTKRLKYLKNLKIENLQKTKIVATVGPACNSYETLLEMVKAGVDVFRLNFSHGAHADHKIVIDLVTKINNEFGTYIGLLADLQGPKLRVGNIENNALEIHKNDIIHFVNKECIGTKEAIYMSYGRLAQDVKIGEKVLIDDGKLVLEVVETDKKSKVSLKVIHGGVLSSKKGVNLPDTEIQLPALTKKDLADLDYILGQPFNWIALSFVRTADDILDLKSRIADRNHGAKVIAKIEKPEAIRNHKQIIDVSDAIMIARGDLGVEVAMEKLPALQKDLIKRCVQKSKPVIVATQMMESMINNPSPTRAEITDVANAVLDGTDAVMLSGETSVGKHPVRVVEAMNKIIYEAEKHYELTGKRPKPNKKSETFFSDTMCIGAAKLAEDIRAKAIIGITVSGYTAFKVSSYRPKSRIFIFSSSKEMLSTMNLIWGVRCFFYNKFSTTDETISDLSEILKEKKLLKTGDVVVNTASMPIQKRFRTNTMKITVIE